MHMYYNLFLGNESLLTWRHKNGERLINQLYFNLIIYMCTVFTWRQVLDCRTSILASSPNLSLKHQAFPLWHGGHVLVYACLVRLLA